MSRRPFYWVDAFTDRALGGNPCAVIFDAEDLDENAMSAIAREMNQPETAFVMRSDIADFRARYFTVEDEIPLAGHPTISVGFALAASGRLPLVGDVTRFRLELQVGPIDIEVLSRGAKASAVIMAQKKPEFLDRFEAHDVAPALGLAEDDLLPGAPVQVVSTGTPQLMVAVKDHAALARAAVDRERYVALTAGGAFMSSHLFCIQGVNADGHVFARHFSHRDGSMEDAFTGSATGAMGAFLWHHALIVEPRFVAQQGHWMGRPGEAGVEVVGPAAAIETVRVAGAGRVLIEGEIDL